MQCFMISSNQCGAKDLLITAAVFVQRDAYFFAILLSGKASLTSKVT